MVITMMMVVVTALVSTPIGILAGVYLAEYGDQSKTASVTRFVRATELTPAGQKFDVKTLMNARWAGTGP